jgi:hypothetical protein
MNATRRQLNTRCGVLAIARWRMLHPDLPVTLAEDGRGYDAVAASRAEALSDAA